MPQRLDRVHIALSSGAFVEIAWDSGTQLLNEVRHLDDAEPVVRAFHAAGASAAVRRTRDGEALLVEAIESWATRVGEPVNLPDGIVDLRLALLDDVRDEAE